MVCFWNVYVLKCKIKPLLIILRTLGIKGNFNDLKSNNVQEIDH